MKEQYIRIIGQLIRLGIIALVFIIPLLFIPLPQNINDARTFSEFSKQILFIASSLTLFALWSLKMILEKKVSIVRTPLDTPLIIFFLIYAVATALSSDIFVSISGFYGLFHPSLLSVFAMILFYFTLVSNIGPKTRFYMLVSFLTSLVLISLINITNYLGWFVIPYEVARVREWVPLLSLGTLAFLASLAIPLSLGLALQSKTSWIKFIGLAYAIILFASLLIVNAFGAWVSLFTSVIVFLIFAPRVISDNKQSFRLAILGALAVVLLVISLTPTLRENVVQPLIKSDDKSLSLVSERRLPIEQGWQVAAGAVGNKPFLGSGPATFPFAFTQYAPLSLNQTNDWNVRFEQASNEYVNLMSSIGLIGLIAFVLILFFLVKPLVLYVTKSTNVKENPIVIFLLAAVGGYIIGSFFFDTSLVIGLLFFLIAASSFSTLNDLGAKGVDKVNLKLVALNAGAIKSFSEKESTSSNIFGYILFVPSLLLTITAFYLVFIEYRAEIGYQQSIIAATENRAVDTRDKLLFAIKTFGFRDIYHRTLSLVDLRIAQGISQQENQTDQNTENIQRLVRESIDQGKIASGYQNPVTVGTSKTSVVNWESLASVYSTLIGVADGAENHTIQTYLGAINRQPRNPLLYEALGNVYLRIKRTDDAIRTLETAAFLKPDLASAHYSLAQAYKQAERDEDAAKELERSLNFLNEDSQDKERIENELEELNKDLEKSSTATPSANTNP